MAIPDAFNNDITSVHYYQGVIIAEVAVTLVLFIILRFVHYIKWGAQD
jgi:hypothetical protein